MELKDFSTPYTRMKHRQYGVITKWGIQTEPVGKIVRRNGQCLEIVGEPNKGRWYPLAFRRITPSLRHRVVIIKKP